LRQLDRKAEPAQQVTEDEVQDPSRLVRLLMSILREVATLKRRWAPRRMDFEDRYVDDTGAATFRFEHRFGGRVRWWAVDWMSDDGGVDLVRDGATDPNTLVLRSYCTGTITLRVEEAG
jgi:hypothetical protein